jgi:hypothetical protein
MSEAPKRIWADGNYEWDSGSWGLSKEFDDDVEYIRADLVEAAIKRALEGAAKEAWKCWIYRVPYHDCQDYIRRLDPAQFIEEPKR